MPTALDHSSKVLAIGSAVVALVAAWKTLPLDAELKRLQIRTEDLNQGLNEAEGRLKEAEAQLRAAESDRKLSFDLYQEVRKILERKDKTETDEEVLRILIESLAEDPFRYKLLSALAVSASNPQVKRSASESSTFYQEESLVAQRAPVRSAADTDAVRASPVGSMDVDVFYCAARQGTAEPIARSVLTLKQPNESGRWRLRLLPESVNQQPGYGITGNEIRYNVPDETAAAQALAGRLANVGYPVSLRPSRQSTRWYVSVFICQ